MHSSTRRLFQLFVFLLAVLVVVEFLFNEESLFGEHPMFVKLTQMYKTTKRRHRKQISHFFKKKRKVPPPYIKSVEFKCSNLDNETEAPRNIVPGITFTLYLVAHNEVTANIAAKWSKCMV